MEERPATRRCGVAEEFVRETAPLPIGRFVSRKNRSDNVPLKSVSWSGTCDAVLLLVTPEGGRLARTPKLLPEVPDVPSDPGFVTSTFH